MNKELMNEITSLEYKSLSEIESASFCKIWKWKSYLGKKGIIKTYFDNKKSRRWRKKRNLGDVIKVIRSQLRQFIMNKEVY